MKPTPMKALSNEQLLSRTQQLVLKERRLNLEILRHLNEIDNPKTVSSFVLLQSL